MAVAIAALAVPAAFAFLRIGVEVPRTAYLLTPLLLVVLIGGSRLAYRAWREGQFKWIFAKPGATPVLVLGAGAAAAALLKDFAARRDLRVLGLLDDAPDKQGGEILGVKIIGTLDEVAAFATRLGVSQAIIAMPGASHRARLRALEQCKAAGLSVQAADIVSGKVSLRALELDDLLGRDPVELDEAGLRTTLGGKTVLVTGAGGSIGAELCRQIARFSPARIVLFDHSEFALYSIHAGP